MKITRASRSCVAILVASIVSIAGPPALAQAPAKTVVKKPLPAKTVKPAIPPAIDAAFKKAFPGATIKNVAKETENGVVQYEVESIDQGRARDLMYLADGTVVTMEEEMSETDFPAAVTAAIKARYPKATITKREKLTITKGSVVQYEAALTGAGVKEATLTADGTWVSPKAPAKRK